MVVRIPTIERFKRRSLEEPFLVAAEKKEEATANIVAVSGTAFEIFVGLLVGFIFVSPFCYHREHTICHVDQLVVFVGRLANLLK
jgi:hypothetical protein